MTLSCLADRFLVLVVLFCFAVAGWSLAANSGRSATTAATFRQPAAAPVEARQGDNQTQHRTVAIESIRLGQRVQGKNPHRHEVSKPSVINANSWRAVCLTMRQHDVTYQLAFLRSLDWIEAAGAREGGTIRLELAEMGLNGPARVEAIEPCPTIEPDDGTHRMVVSGTMCHLADNILNVYISGLDEPLGVTDTHPIWSETRQDFVVVGQLQVGERLRSETGVVSQVTRITPHRGPPQLTYNLEVDGEHVYQVASSSILVHNACHGNSILSPNPQHGYVIVDDAGHILKYGISGGPITKAGESYRALAQVRKLQQQGINATSQILETAATRADILKWEKEAVEGFTKIFGHKPPLNFKP